MVYVFAIVARDLDGRNVTGPMSNIVTTTLRDRGSNGSRNSLAIIMIVIGVVALAATLLIIGVVVCYVKCKKNKKAPSRAKGDRYRTNEDENAC